MKNQQPNNSIITYFNGWDVALRNYDVFETESIIHLVSFSKDQLSPDLTNLNEQNTHYLAINFSE